MEKFKVGDTLRCVNAGINITVGKFYRVLQIHDVVFSGVRIKDDSGFERFVFSDRFEIAKPELTKAQAAGVAGGLQEHSVGDSYPWAVVMYEHEGSRRIAIENLQTGEVNAIQGRVVNWNTFEEAYKRLERGPITNITKGRVMYQCGDWVVVQEVNPVRVTRLHSMLHHG